MRLRQLTALSTIYLVTGCNGPLAMLPGGELQGDVVSAESWAFAAVFETLELETRAESGSAYSVKVGFVLRGDRLYIDPASERRWYGNIVDRPNVRVRFSDGKIYRARAVPVADPGEREGFDPDRHVLRLELAD